MRLTAYIFVCNSLYTSLCVTSVRPIINALSHASIILQALRLKISGRLLRALRKLVIEIERLAAACHQQRIDSIGLITKLRYVYRPFGLEVAFAAIQHVE